ncbi:acyl-CoA dehydrogenase family protein [Streptomyces mirabilis]|uniref:acyl-CoA dehydrogenase family protein n=1 Tax=Streptomyces mirabilis TaxID=68239 RepID=UPI0033207FF3
MDLVEEVRVERVVQDRGDGRIGVDAREQRGHRGEVDHRRAGGGERTERPGQQRGPDKVADICTEFEAARWAACRAVWLADQGCPRSTEAAMAKLYASEVANRAASASVQIHRGHGYVRESEISRFHADAKILEIGEGTNEIQRNVIARALVKQG